MIYHYVFASSKSHGVLIPAKASSSPPANVTTSATCRVMGPPHIDRSTTKHEFAALKINRQTREEIVPIFCETYNFTFHDETSEMVETTKWLEALSKDHLRLVRHVTVNRIRGIICWPLKWVRFEEEYLSQYAQDLHVRLEFVGMNEMEAWHEKYGKCRALRSAGIRWDRLRMIFATWEVYGSYPTRLKDYEEGYLRHREEAGLSDD